MKENVPSGDDYHEFDDQATREKFELADLMSTIRNGPGSEGMTEDEIEAQARQILEMAKKAELEESGNRYKV